MASIDELEKAAELANGLPAGMLAAVRKQETGGQSKYIEAPDTYHYELNSDGRRIARHTGKVSTAFGPYGILESTARDPGYGVKPLGSKALEDQVGFAAAYLAGRAKHAGSLEAGLAGYGEGDKYANQVLKRIKSQGTQPMTTTAQTPIDGMVAGNQERNNVAADALSQMFDEIGKHYNNAATTLERTGEDVQLIKTTEALATAEAQRKTADFATRIGTNPDAATFALNRLVSQSSELFDKQMQLGAQVQEAANPENLFKNPFKFLVDRAMMPSRIKEYNAATAQAQAVNSRIATLNNLTQEVAQTNNLIKQSVTTESALAIGRVAKAEIDLKVDNLRIEALKTNAEGISKVATLRNNNLDIALRGRDQQLQEGQIEISRANAIMQAEQLRLVGLERTERAKNAEEGRVARQTMLDAVNLARRTNGGLREFASFEELELAGKMDTTTNQLISQQLRQGLEIGQTGRATVANNVWDALKYTRTSGAKLDDGRAKVIAFSDKILQMVNADKNLPPEVRKSEPKMAEVVNRSALTQAHSFLGNITAGTGNIYSPPPASALLSDPNFGSTYIGSKVLKPMVDGGIEELQPKNIVNILINDMKAGKITPQQVDSELGFMAEKIVGYNNETYRYNETAGLPNMSSVRVPLDNSGAWQTSINKAFGPGTLGYGSSAGRTLNTWFGGESEEIVDLRDPVSRMSYINKRQAALLPPVLRQQATTQSKTGN